MKKIDPEKVFRILWLVGLGLIVLTLLQGIFLFLVR
jgi:hypothetical protein